MSADDVRRGEQIATSGKYNGTIYADEPGTEDEGSFSSEENDPGDDEHQGDPEEPQDVAEPPRFTGYLLNRSALDALPDPEPLIDDVLDQGTLALLYGQWGTGKSFIALDWAASVATGRNWQGRPTESRRVLYVAAEGAFGLKGRLHAWEAGWKNTIGDDTFDVLPKSVNLTSYAEVRDLAALIKWNGYGLVVFDTLARCMVGADENNAKDCGQVVENMSQLRAATPDGRGVVLGVHHTGKDGRTFRGSSVFEAGADTVYSVIRDGGVIVLDREKRKDGPPTDTHRLKIDPIDGTGSAVISSHGGVKNTDRSERLFFTFLQCFSDSGASRSQLRSVADMTDATFYRAVSDLLKSGHLINEGTEQRPFYKAGAK